MVALPAGVIAVALAWNSIQQHQQQIQERLADKADAVARATEDYLLRHQQGVRLLATTLSGEAPGAARMQDLLTRHLETFDGLLSVLVTDRPGRISAVAMSERIRGTAPAPETLIGSSVADRPYFSQVLTSHQPYTSGVFQGRGIGTHRLVAMSAPVHDRTGGFNGVAEVSLDLGSLTAVWSAHGRINGAVARILDPAGEVVFDSQHSSTGAEGNGTAWIGQALSATSQLDNGWQVVVRQPGAALREFIWREIGRVCMLLLPVVLVSGFAARVIGNRITEPLEQLSRHVQRFRSDSDSWNRDDAVSYPPSEVADVLSRFNEVAMGFATSVTELSEANEQESRLRRRLQDVVSDRETEIERRTRELQERTEALGLAAEAASAADLAKSEFLANMSHEMRTPLTAIIGFTEAVLEDVEPASGMAEQLEIVLLNSRHLHQLIGDILDLSKIESGELQLESKPVDVAWFFASLQRQGLQHAQAKGLSFTLTADLPLPRYLKTDLTRLKQIAFNLVSNALKFTRHGGITVHLDADPKAARFRFAVTDTGIGVAADAVERIFERFQQADSSVTRKYGGTGLGLVISRQLAQAMGGDLTLVSEVGRGSTFTVTLPISSDPALADRPPITRMADFTPPAPAPKPLSPAIRCAGRVLVADDSSHNRLLISMYLQRMGATAICVSNGQEALEHVLADPPDLVLMDMHMPIMGGLEATRRIRLACSTPVPVIALTADVLPEHQAEQLAAGCNDVLAKPLDRMAFLRVVGRYLRPEPATNDTPRDASAAPSLDTRRAFVDGLDNEIRAVADNVAAGDIDGARRALTTLAERAADHGLGNLSVLAAGTVRASEAAAGPYAAASTLDTGLTRLQSQLSLAQRAMALAS